MAAIKQLLIQQQENEVNTPLARQFWTRPEQDPVMVASFTHFDGAYPEPGHEKTCKTNWVTSGHGHKVNSVTPVTFSLWRGYTMQAGELVAPCEHCKHKRVMGFCKRIERASKVYTKSNLMRWVKLPDADVKRRADRIRKRNERAEDSHINYTTFPLGQGKTILLHDAPDIEGEPLPSDRGELYDLVATWVLETPKGKRAGHGLSAWGMVDGRTEEDEQEKPGAGEKQGNAGPKGWRLIGKNYSHMAMLLGAYLDKDIPAKGAKLDLDLSALLDFLHEAGIDYAIDGQLPEDVTLNRRKENTTSAKCDTKGIGEEKSRKEPAEKVPAPIYLVDYAGQGVLNVT